MRRTAIIPSALAAALALLLVLGTSGAPVAAYIQDDTAVYLLGQGGDQYDDDNYRAYVDYPASFALDQDSWNVTVWLEYINLSGSGQDYDPGYSVQVYLDDGNLNYSLDTETIVESQTSKSYSNLSFDESTISLFTANSSAQLTATLTNDSAANDTYSTNVGIYENQATGSINTMIPMIISVMLLGIMIAFVSQIADEFGGMTKGKKRPRRKRKK